MLPVVDSDRTRRKVPLEKSVGELFHNYCLSSSKESYKDILKKALVFKSDSLPGSISRKNISSPRDGPPSFAKDVLYYLSSKIATNSGNYTLQSLVVFVFEESISFTNLSNSEIDLSKLVTVLIFERSSDFQSYILSKLSTSPHLALLTVDLPTMVNNMNQLLDQPVEVVLVPCIVLLYSHPTLFAMVMNASYDRNLSDNITKASTAMFEAGLGRFFSLQDQGRGDIVGAESISAKDVNGSMVSVQVTKNDCSIPTLTTGYSNMDC